MRELLTRRDPQRTPGIAGERRGPLARPSHRDHQPAIGRHEVVVRELPVAPASPGRGEPRDDAGAEGPLERLVEIGGEGVALPVMKHELPFRPTRQRDVDPLDRLEQARIPTGGVLEIDRPFHGGEIRILDRRTANLEARDRIGPCRGAPRAGGVEPRGFRGLRPGREQAGRGLSAVDEREGQARTGGRQVRLDPVRLPLHLAGRHELRRPGGARRDQDSQDHEDEPAGSSRTTCAGEHDVGSLTSTRGSERPAVPVLRADVLVGLRHVRNLERLGVPDECASRRAWRRCPAGRSR